jgi:hypothetical protein
VKQSGEQEGHAQASTCAKQKQAALAAIKAGRGSLLVGEVQRTSARFHVL